ncbi:dihydrofolate reductase [Kordiimonas aestuarii]|uniref:dihydrofolate reductase n=1 Tax=Kordiimonas aestuarii TaxID=1005925 RepID=UPI0021D27866|nr:dihydrofolate reductase [Kordiimonas aestuarii]
MISMIVAMAENRAIGKGNALPWHLPADLKHFKSVTMGKPMIMGRKTFDSIGRPLPGRRTIVVTRDAGWHRDGVDVAYTLERAIELAETVNEVMIVGGAQIYQQALPHADRLYVTEVSIEADGDAFFPAFSKEDWQETDRQDFAAEGDTPAYSFVIYDRQ